MGQQWNEGDLEIMSKKKSKLRFQAIRPPDASWPGKSQHSQDGPRRSREKPEFTQAKQRGLEWPVKAPDSRSYTIWLNGWEYTAESRSRI